MNPHYNRHPEAHHTADSRPSGSNFARKRGMHAVNARPPPSIPYRRYPSLSDDGQPYFPRLRRARRNAAENLTAMKPNNETDHTPFFSVRAFALLAIIVIIAVLVASA